MPKDGKFPMPKDGKFVLTRKNPKIVILFHHHFMDCLQIHDNAAAQVAFNNDEEEEDEIEENQVLFIPQAVICFGFSRPLRIDDSK